MPIFLQHKLLLSQQKLGRFLENKVLQTLKFPKNANNEKCASKMILFNDVFLDYCDPPQPWTL